MIGLEYEMTHAETIEGPLGPTSGSPLGERLCWQVTNATLRGPRIDATLAMPGRTIRLGADGIRRQDLRAQLVTQDGDLIRSQGNRIRARPGGLETCFRTRSPSGSRHHLGVLSRQQEGGQHESLRRRRKRCHRHTRLIPQLINRGHEVIGTYRSPANSERVRALEAEPLMLDLLDAGAVRKAVLDVKPDAIVHQATALADIRFGRYFDRMFAQTNRGRTEGTDALLAAAREAGVRRFVAQSFASMRNAREGGMVKS
jgi:hypothetical protein